MRGRLEGTFDIYLQFCKELTICCIWKLFNYSESPNNALHPLCIWHIVFTGKSCNKTFPDGSIYDSCLVHFVSMVMHVFGFSPPGSPPGKPGEYVGENRGMDWFLPFPFKFKGKVKGGGGFSGGGGTQGKSMLSCAAEAFKPWPCLRQKLLILPLCLRQETLLSDSDLFCFAYRIK